MTTALLQAMQRRSGQYDRDNGLVKDLWDLK